MTHKGASYDGVGVQMALAADGPEQGSDKSGSHSKNDQLKMNFVTGKHLE